MSSVIFVTGNKKKVKLMEDYMGGPIKHEMVDLDEIQSMDLHEVTEHKVRQAYSKIGSPVLVEDVAVRVNALNGLPGPFVKWFWQTLSLEGFCRLLDQFNDRRASVEITFAYFDGSQIKFFDGRVEGTISDSPRGEGFGWNPIFIPAGSNKTYAETENDNDPKASFRASTVYPQIKEFLAELDKIR